MAITVKRIIIGLVFTFISIHAVSAISCYKCNSKFNPGCEGDKIDPSFITDCGELKNGSKFDRCRKIMQWVDNEHDGNKPDSRVIRDCGWYQGKDERECYYRAGFGGRQQVCSCQSDNCNSATNLGPMMYGFITTIAVCLLNFL